jgi:hypothetical protein
VIHLAFGQQGDELLPYRVLLMYGEIAGMEMLLHFGKLE